MTFSFQYTRLILPIIFSMLLSVPAIADEKCKLNLGISLADVQNSIQEKGVDIKFNGSETLSWLGCYTYKNSELNIYFITHVSGVGMHMDKGIVILVQQ